jgi:predicted ribosome quality control (RQC) complex YloA/Tae2 family protein
MSIVFGRAAIASEPNRWLDNDTLLDAVQSNRMLLDLEPLGDPIEDYLDWTFEKDFSQTLDHGKDKKIDGLKSKLEEAREKGGKAISDLRKKEIELSALEKRIAEKVRADREQGEKNKVLPARPSKSAALHDDESANENRKQISNLKEKIAFLQGEIRSHQENRQEYRQKIREAERTIAKLSDRQNIPETVSEEAGEAPAEVQAGFQRIAIPEFSKTFRKNCESLPQDIVARALQATTAFAAREDGVLRQAKKLELIPDMFRIRIGRSYRLLVRQTTQQSLEVLDLIPRGQLENWIRRHMA